MITPLEIALGEYNTHGINNGVHNLRIVDYFRDTGQSQASGPDTPWCAAFLDWVLMKAGKPTTGSLAARSFLNYGSAAVDPAIGDVVVLWRDDPKGPLGHCGLFIRELDGMIYILGGNQSNAVNITPFSKSRLLAYRRPPATVFPDKV